MQPTNSALLADRGVVRVAGPDAAKLLQGVVTNDMDLLASREAIYAGLLTPQGKILFDFLVVRQGDGYLLDTAAGKTAELAKRLQMYRLRARVEITEADDRYRVAVAWGTAPREASLPDGAAAFTDPRHSGLGRRILVPPHLASALAAPEDGRDAAATAYHAHRIALGVPEGGKDFAFGDNFPHEANFDALNGVSFTKGCFVGQEVVSRIQHRGNVRKRVVIVESAAGPLQTGAGIQAGAAVIGTVGSVDGRRGLALVRLDRAEEARAKGELITVNGAPIGITMPDYLKTPEPAGAP
jgi:folate-binding protein YgfZ